MSKEQKKQLFGFGLPIILGTILLLSASYAWLQLTLNGTKTNVLKVEDLSLELDDKESVGINGDGVVPVLDAVGLAEDPYTFKLINHGSTDNNYTIYLDNVDLEEGETQLPDDAIKFDLKKGDTTLIRTLLSYVTEEDHDRVLDTGIIKGGETFSYDLRMWVDEAATQDMAAGKTFRGKIRVEAEQVVEHAPTPEECFEEIYEKGKITGYLCGTRIFDFDQWEWKLNTPEQSPAGRIITDVVIPKTIDGTAVTAIGDYAFGMSGTGTGLTSVVIPEGITVIGQEAFAYNQLTSVVIPEGVTTIDFDAFYHVPLKNVYLPESLEEIGQEAFGQTQLTSVVIPANVKRMRYGIFGNGRLVSVTIKGKKSVTDFEDWQYAIEEDNWLQGSVCHTYASDHWQDGNLDDDNNPCVHWEP